jgi:RNA polymerase sigma-70 factor, ECF subfamily
MRSAYDPLWRPEPLIRRVYAYVAYRIGDGPDAEDVTSTVFERALRYRSTFDPRKGEPVSWLLGIAQRCVAEARTDQHAWPAPTGEVEVQAPGDLEADTLGRIGLAAALQALDDRDRELVALRYGADLSARRIGELLGMETNAVHVALHRARARLRESLDADGFDAADGARERPAPGWI